MAFDPKRFSRIAGAGSGGLWLLHTSDAAATVDTAGYIAPASSYFGTLRVGDVVIRVTFTDTTYTAVSSWGLHIVIGASATSIDLSDALAGVVTNTD